MIYTNGLRLADASFARGAVEAGIAHFQIALFGADGAAHDAVTQVAGSFERTLEALETLSSLREGLDFLLEIRLLFSRQSSQHNPAIVRLLHERGLHIDAISLNRLNLSKSAADADATISWEEARESVNESARLIRELGYTLKFRSVPLCVFEGGNAEFVRSEMTRWATRVAAGLEPRSWQSRYLDPGVTGNIIMPSPPPLDAVLPAPCVRCDYASACERVAGWYVRRYGHAGLRTVRLSAHPLPV
jgi:MoaA/NifB/PqqE/SkfB family radical SAM enzyme